MSTARRQQLLDVEVFGGWVLRLWRRRGPQGVLFDLAITPPARDVPAFEVRLWPSLERAWESAARHLSTALRISPLYVASALQSLLETEAHP